MFSSILPNASSSAKFVHNGHPKNSSRFSVRVFRTPTASVFPYPMAAKVDLGYRSVQQSEQQRYIPRYASSSSRMSGLIGVPEPSHDTSNHNILYDTRLRGNNYAIYPGASSDTFIYEQSDYDALSTATFSPAMSTDSTLTLRGPGTPEPFLEERARRPTTPAAPSSYVHGSMAPQAPAMSRTMSNHHAHESSADASKDHRSRVTSMQGHSTTPMRVPISSANLNDLAKVSSTTTGYNGQLPNHIPEYAPSTISELEVDERDRIAKINAEYNAVSSSSSSSYYSNNNVAVAIEPNVRRMSTSPPNQPSPDTYTRVASAQPLHSNLHFPTKPDDYSPTFNPNPTTPSIFSTKDGSPPLVERVPSRVQFPPTNTQSSQFPPVQAQDSWNRDGVYHTDHTRVSPPYRPPPPVTSNHPFDNGSARSTQTTYANSQETMNLNEYRPLPVPPEVPRQGGRAERRPSVVGPRPDVNVLKAASDARLRSQLAREYPYDHSEPRRDVSNSPPRGELPSRAAMASETRRDTRTPAPRESNDYRPAPPTRHDSYVAEVQKLSVDLRSNIPHPTDTRDMYQPPSTSSPTQLHFSPPEVEGSKQPAHLQPAAFIGSTEPERSNDRGRGRSTSFSSPTRPNLPPMNNQGQHLSSSQQYQASSATMPDPRRVAEQDKPVRTSPPSRVQEPSVYHSDYVEPERRNDVRGSSSQAVYNSQPTTPSFNRDTHSSQRQNIPIGQPSFKSDDRAPSYPTINSRNVPQEVPSSRSKTSYVEVPTTHAKSGSPTRGSAPYDKPSIPVKIGSSGGYSSSSNSTDQGFVPPEQPTQRRYSDGDQNPPTRPVEPSSGRNSAPLVRSVRWNENLICPSPIFASQRRKGWFNRRGDQLWTNDGVFKPPAVGQEYPPEFDDYPEHGEGWMNEENIRIDMGHRLVPKPPLRSALKQPK
ncbi:hypothetical protein BYT27DRAFT_6377321 [Phlegmacium glaucopus]|nr:hypothetical protein BYT27DRAFT_6377321 [Phlegmacium glaucopus]